MSESSEVGADLHQALGGHGSGAALAGVAAGLKLAALHNLRARARESMVERLRERGLPAADSDALWMGWAGALNADSRADLLLHDLARLERLLDDPMQAVRLIIAGTPADGVGQEQRERLDELANSARFEGRLLVLPELGPASTRVLTQGVDLWLDTALERAEAGESVEPVDAAAANGALVVSTAAHPWASWTVAPLEEFDDRSGRDEFDARRMLELLEREIVPCFYDWDHQAMSKDWLERARNTLRSGLAALP